MRSISFFICFVSIGLFSLLLTACGETKNKVYVPPSGTVSPVSAVPSWVTEARTSADFYCFIDKVNAEALRQDMPVLHVKKGEPLVLEGWALDMKGGKDQSDVLLELAKTNRSAVYYFSVIRNKRPDVSGNEKFAALKLDNPGMLLYADSGKLSPGQYLIGVVMKHGKGGVACTVNKAWLIEIEG